MSCYLTTKAYRAGSDLLLKHLYDELNAQILGVVAYHPDVEEPTNKFGMPFSLYFASRSIERCANLSNLNT
ncbi:MAG: hypothetical protein NZM38_08485 [Cytophagales bacterium]|nr:hypothetical protein [Cytophagales bacterium]MDW8384795.1 hypothetical protein [Flammeovirgaceae bacterium]